jgi:hypothetical protein
MKTFRTKHTIMAPRAGLGLLSLQLAAAPVASAWSLTINLGLGVNSAAPVRTQRTLSPLEGWSPPVHCDQTSLKERGDKCVYANEPYRKRKRTGL